MSLKSEKINSLAGTDREYVEVEKAEGLRVRVMNQKGDGEGESKFVRIHVLKKAKAINSRERDDYFALDVPWGSIIKIASRLFDDVS